jgi:hypothetical protein
VPTTTSYGIDTNWYVDSGATDHITSDLDKLSVIDRYMGNDQVHTANDSGMKIKHIGSSTLHTSSRDLVLKDILHVPDANKNLVSIHRLALDNHVFLKLHLWYFLIKDQETRTVLHRGKVERGLYLLNSSHEDKLSVQLRCPMRDGVIHLFLLSSMFLAIINFQ